MYLKLNRFHTILRLKFLYCSLYFNQIIFEPRIYFSAHFSGLDYIHQNTNNLKIKIMKLKIQVILYRIHMTTSVLKSGFAKGQNLFHQQSKFYKTKEVSSEQLKFQTCPCIALKTCNRTQDSIYLCLSTGFGPNSCMEKQTNKIQNPQVNNFLPRNLLENISYLLNNQSISY